MAIAKLTGQGLTAIAISVGLLWGCILGERIILKNARLEAGRTMIELRLLKMRRSQPVAVPALKIPRPAVSAVG
jgi:hypothetical protein